MNDFIPLRKNLIKTHRELKKLFYMAKKSKNYNIALKIIESNRILREELTAADFANHIRDGLNTMTLTKDGWQASIEELLEGFPPP